MEFEDVIGNEKVKQELLKRSKEDRIVNSYLWTGSEGIGKKKLAIIFAKLLLCQNQEPKCHTCPSCIKFETDNHPDFFLIEPDGKSIKIEQIREMQEKVYEKPIIASRKVYIINDAEKMTKEAQNCLLKTLEEPPSYAVIILISSNETALLLTIKSRCLKIPFEKISEKELVEFLKKQNFGEISQELLKLYDGSIGKALALKEKKEEYQKIADCIQKIEQYDIIEQWKNSEIFTKNKEDSQEILNYLNVWLYQKAKEDARYLGTIGIVEEAKNRLVRNANFDMTIDQMLLKIWEEIHEKHRRN